MTRILVSTSNGVGAPPLAADLDHAGFTTIDISGSRNFVQCVIENQADLLTCFELVPDAAFFESMASLGRLAPRPVVVFTTDIDADKIALATRSAVHAYIVNGYQQNRLRSVLQLAQARFASEAELRQELALLQQRFAERKLVDRAKGILMGARQLREEEAFRVLRSAAMASKQRIGQLSQMVINAATFAEAVNRAGQLRMLSQRLVKLYVLACPAICAAGRAQAAALLADSVALGDGNLALLARSLSRPTHGDLIDSVSVPWGKLKSVLQEPPQRGRIGALDELAEEVLRRAERLTGNLEVAAFATALRVINISGRQRMLSQRLAKEALLASLSATASVPSVRDFTEGLAWLAALPMSNETLASELQAAMAVWQSLHAALEHAATESGRAGILALSETLLGHFDRLTDEFERAMQTLVG